MLGISFNYIKFLNFLHGKNGFSPGVKLLQAAGWAKFSGLGR
jgi:hypothetical protein